ncbi:MAG: hypothetical protein IMW97_01395 [Firmicutes bacterium]|nr:hypothetical protein [Candidatus Fermentithermobacillaceae bacterium]
MTPNSRRTNRPGSNVSGSDVRGPDMAGHYSPQQWAAFKKGFVPGELRRQMEEHLSTCDVCLETYLATVDARDVELAEMTLRPDFVQRVLSALARGPGAALVRRPDAEQVCARSHGHRRRCDWERQNPTPDRLAALRNYAVAAAITLMLLAGGWFDAVSRTAPSALYETGKTIVRVSEEMPSGWSNKVIDRISSWVDAVMR